MRIRQAFVSSAGAAALTVVAAASALVVNLGLLRQPPGDGVGTLAPDQVETTTTFAPAPDRYVTIYVPDSTLPADPAPVTTVPTATVSDAVPVSYEDDQYEQEGHEDDGWEHEQYEGAEDDD